MALQNLGATRWASGQLARASELADESHEAASRFGLIGQLRGGRGDRAADQYVLGHWQEALEVADELLAEVDGGSPHFSAPWCYKTRAQIRMGRDDVPGALADAHRALELAGIEREGQNLYPTLAACAHIFRETGDRDRAAALADEVLHWLRAGSRSGTIHNYLHVLAWTLTPWGGARNCSRSSPFAPTVFGCEQRHYSPPEISEPQPTYARRWALSRMRRAIDFGWPRR